MTRRGACALVLIVMVAACGGGSGKTQSSSGDKLTGLFAVTAGACASGPSTGSWFRMVQPGGTLDAGPYVSNADSTCGTDQTFTPLSPGTDGGLRTGGFQPQPDPPFAPSGGSAATEVIKPQPFFGVEFGASTNEHDPQTGKAVPVPTITANGSSLSGDLSAFSVAWNGQQFNQGAPKPGESANGSLHGTFDKTTGAYSLDWSSRISGGPFDGFTGLWHFEGVFKSA